MKRLASKCKFCVPMRLPMRSRTKKSRSGIAKLTRSGRRRKKEQSKERVIRDHEAACKEMQVLLANETANETEEQVVKRQRSNCIRINEARKEEEKKVDNPDKLNNTCI